MSTPAMSGGGRTAPTPTARRFVRLVVGFSVGVGIGVAPFLGKVRVLGFEPLSGIFPEHLRDVFIAFGAFLMGVIAVAVQVLAVPRWKVKRLTTFSVRSMAATLVSMVLLCVVYFLVVVRVQTSGRDEAVVTGWSRISSCPCTTPSDELCAEELSLRPGASEVCWCKQVQVSRLVLCLLYLASIGCFAAVVGSVLAFEQVRQRGRAAGSGRGRQG
jgi:hypothetical protein